MTAKIVRFGLSLFFLTVLLLEVAFFAQKFSPREFFRDPDFLQTAANQILDRCKTSSFHPNCYDEEIPKLMDTLTMNETFEVTRRVQAQDSSYYYCHTLGHDLSALEVRKDPSKWKEVARSCPFEMCSNGCIHGAFQERYRTSALPKLTVEELSTELAGLCEPGDGFEISQVTVASCYHALGHLTMYVTVADIQKSLDLCDAIASNGGKKELAQLCYDGVFMQIFQPLEPEDFALIEGKEQTRESAPQFCQAWSQRANSSCWTESWPLYSDEIKTSASGADEFCSKAPSGAQARCYQVVFSILGAQNTDEPHKILDYCSALQDPKNQGNCVAFAVARFLEIDAHLIPEAVALCEQAPQENMKNACWDMMVTQSDYAYKPGSENFYAVCNAIPEPWQEKCLGKHR
jgi:hypothetical protein